MIEVVFLDAGETILHPHPSFADLFADVCTANGYPVGIEESTAVQGRLAPHLVDLAEETGVENPSLSAEGSRRFWSYTYRRLLAELGIDDEGLVARLYETFSSSSSYRLFDDAIPALSALRAAGFRLGLISNFEDWLEQMLVELEIGDVFEISVISGLEGVEKPDPAIYELALARAGVEPGRAAHVGDSPTMDIEPASAAGMLAVLVDRVDRYPDFDTARVSSLTELPSLLTSSRRPPR